MAFKLRSGNKTPFKMMGSSPVKNGHDDEKKDTRNEATKELDIALDEIDRYRLYEATQKDNEISSTTGKRSTTETIKVMRKANENRSNRGAGRIYPTVGNTTVPVTTNTTYDPGYKDPVTEKTIDTKDVSIKNRQSNFDDFLEENPNYDNVVHEKDGSTNSRNRTFDAESNIISETSTTTRGFTAPKVNMPSLKPIASQTPKLTQAPSELIVKKAKLPPELREKKKEVKTKKTKTERVKRPKGTKTRNLVTGGKNRTFRSTGTSKRKNRVIAGLTFWNSKD